MENSNEGRFGVSRLMGPGLPAVPIALGVLAGLTWSVIANQGDLGWDDADYLRDGLKAANAARSAWPVEPFRAAGALLRVRPKPPMLVGWIGLGGMIPALREPIRLIVHASVVPFAFLLFAVIGASRRLFGPRTTGMAVLAVVASPMALAFGAKVMVETFMALWILLAYFLAARQYECPRKALALGLGAALGLVVMTKMTAVLFLGVPGLWFGHRFVARHGARAGARWLPWVVAPFLLVAGPWYLDNLGEAIRFAAFSAQYNVIALGEARGIPRIERPFALIEILLGGPLLGAVALSCLAAVARKHPTWARSDSSRTFLVLSILGAASGAVLLLIPPYFDPRFLLPIWPSLAVALSPALRDASWGGGRILAVATNALLLAGLAGSASRVGTGEAHGTSWGARGLIDHLVSTYHVKTIYNVGNCADWNVSKTGFVNELRADPGDCFVLHDLSRADPEEYARRIPGADAVVALDRGRIPAGWFAYGPELNKGCDRMIDLLDHDRRFSRVAFPRERHLPPLLVYVKKK